MQPPEMQRGGPGKAAPPAKSLTSRPDEAIVTDPADIQRMLALSDERDQWIRARVAFADYSYKRGWRDGWEAGRTALLEEMAEAERCTWQAIEPVLMSPDFAELELRRWGPGGRARFADPRPGDFPGRQVKAA